MSPVNYRQGRIISPIRESNDVVEIVIQDDQTRCNETQVIQPIEILRI